MNLVQYLKNDEDLAEMRSRWMQIYKTPFPPYNYAEYDGIEDYKEKLRAKLNIMDSNI